MAERNKSIIDALLARPYAPPKPNSVVEALLGRTGVPRPPLPYLPPAIPEPLKAGPLSRPPLPQVPLRRSFGEDMATLPGRLGAAISAPVGALDRFGRTMLGQSGGWDSTNQVIDDANTLAGFATTGGMAMPRPTNSLSMFAGITAKTADLGALDKAKALAAQGVGRDTIWNETGWFRGVDGEWRFEIPDGPASFRDYAVPSKSPFAKEQMVYDYLKQRGYDLKKNSVTGGMLADETSKVKPEDYKAAWAYAHANAGAGPEVPLGQVATHDRLFAAYPELKNIAVTNDVPNGYGGMSWGGKVGVANTPMVDARSTLLHELQHEIQNKENFARGSNKVDAETVLNDAANAASALAWRREIEAQAKLNPGMGAADLEELVLKDYKALGMPVPSSRIRYMAKASHLSDYSSETLEAMAQALRYPGDAGTFSRSVIDDAYHRHAGEVESRNVQARRNMKPEELRTKPPWYTQDVPDNQQIVLYRSGVVAKPKLST